MEVARSQSSLRGRVALALAAMVGSQALAQSVLPRPEPPFHGQIGRTSADSTPDFPVPVSAPAGAPNVLLIMTDDVGFGASSPFGGPIPMPNFDRLAASGVRFTQFHTTALCSPTRAALITGRNHHSASTGVITEMATGFPGYNSLMSRSCGTIGEVLRQNGYNTSWYGKNHNVPDWQTSMAGPFDLWPTGLGFEYFYGFLGGDTDQWHPAVFEGTKPIEAGHGDPDYHFDVDLADHAIAWIRQQNAVAPDRPFFAYYTPGTAHAPHHAPREWIERMHGKFDQGWDRIREETYARQMAMGILPPGTELTQRPSSIPAWDSLSADQRRFSVRTMEVYAAALAHCDAQIGRVLDAVEETGEMDNTLIIFIMGDNGASGEGTLNGLTNEVAVAGNGVTEDIPFLLSQIDNLGGPLSYGHYSFGWAHAMCTPFQWTKQVASHFGGTRNGLVVSWPARLNDDAGQLRAQFHHVIDITPTILEAVGVEMPAVINGVTQKPVEGTSMLYAIEDAAAPSHRPTQYFEMIGNRAIYHDGWVACTTPIRLPWDSTSTPSPDDFEWELYHVAEDFSQANDLAAAEPEQLRMLQELWWAEAGRYNVVPLDTSFAQRVDPAIRPSLTRGRDTFTYYPGMVRIPEATAPDIKNRSYAVTADVEVPTGGASGVLATQGGRFGGWGLLMVDGKPMFVHKVSNQPAHEYRIASTTALTPGHHTIRFEFTYDGGGRGKGGAGRLLVDGAVVAQGRIGRTVGTRFSLDETFDVGADTGTPVLEGYVDDMPFEFGGTLNSLTIELK